MNLDPARPSSVPHHGFELADRTEDRGDNFDNNFVGVRRSYRFLFSEIEILYRASIEISSLDGYISTRR